MTPLVLDPFPHQVRQRSKRRRGCKSAFFFFSTAHLVIMVAGMLIASTCNLATFIQSSNRAEQITAVYHSFIDLVTLSLPCETRALWEQLQCCCPHTCTY